MGLVSKVVEGGKDEVVKAALETAKVIAAKSPIAIVGTKRKLLHSRDHTYVLETSRSCTDGADMRDG